MTSHIACFTLHINIFSCLTEVFGVYGPIDRTCREGRDTVQLSTEVCLKAEPDCCRCREEAGRGAGKDAANFRAKLV